MKISIDTKEDSHDEIKKVIKMLEHLINKDPSPTYNNSGNIFDDPSPSLGSSESSYGLDEPSSETSVGGEVQSAAPTNAFSAMFGGDAPAPVESEEISSYEGDKEKKLDLDAEIVPY